MSKTVLITGGTRGIGAALVSEYLKRGFQVLATGSSSQSVAKAQLEMPNAEWFECNFSQANSIEHLASDIGCRHLDIVIHNAGVQQQRNYFKVQRRSNC